MVKSMESEIELDSALTSQDYAKRVGFSDQKPRLVAIIMIMLFILAGAVRLYRINAPGLLIDREYTSAILARDFYFEHANTVEDWRKAIAHITRQNQPVLEPPITKWLVSLLYRAADSEQIWFARFLTSSFWLIGGVFYSNPRKS